MYRVINNNNNNKRIYNVVTSEALWPGSVLLRKEREKAREKTNVLSLDLNTAAESLLTTVSSSEFLRDLPYFFVK